MYRIEAACINHMGYIRENNEDNFYFKERFLELDHGNMEAPLTDSFSTEQETAVAVFDGMGGENAGETASYIAAEVFSAAGRISKISKSGFQRMVHRLNAEVCKKAEEERLGQIGTTMTALFFQGNYVYVVNVGDSPAYIFRKNRLKLISEKHTNEEFLKLSNQKGLRPALTQFLGIPRQEMVLEPYIAGMELKEGDIFFACSDGLTDMVSEEEVQAILTDCSKPECMVEKLLESALQNGGKDNITIICCKVLEGGDR